MIAERQNFGELIGKRLDDLVKERQRKAKASLEQFQANEELMIRLDAGILLDELASALRDRGFEATANTTWNSGRIEEKGPLKRHPEFVGQEEIELSLRWGVPKDDYMHTLAVKFCEAGEKIVIRHDSLKKELKVQYLGDEIDDTAKSRFQESLERAFFILEMHSAL